MAPGKWGGLKVQDRERLGPKFQRNNMAVNDLVRYFKKR